MGALWAVIGGILAITIGIIGIIKWWLLFLKALLATIPVLLILGGAIALFIGFSELKDSLSSKENNSFCDMKPESEETDKAEEESSSTEESTKKSKSTSKSE